MNKVLLVEDDPILLEMYKDKFVKEGFSVETAVNGEEGIATMKSFQPDIMLLDLIMPQSTGFSVLKFIKLHPEYKHIPIIILTNIYADGEDLVKNWGVKHFLLKSNSTPDLVVEKVMQVLHPSIS
jgi:CheY-like chemotaxis protein